VSRVPRNSVSPGSGRARPILGGVPLLVLATLVVANAGLEPATARAGHRSGERAALIEPTRPPARHRSVVAPPRRAAERTTVASGPSADPARVAPVVVPVGLPDAGRKWARRAGLLALPPPRA